MPRILIVECMQEISSFNPLPSEYENFHILRGDEIYEQRGRNQAIGGALSVFDARGRRRGGCGDLGPLGERRAPVGRRLAQAFGRDHGPDQGDDRPGRRGLFLAARRDGRRRRARSRRLAAAGNARACRQQADRHLARPARHPHRPDAAAGRRPCDLLDLSACRFRRYRAARGRAPAAADRPGRASRRSRASSSRRWCAATS